MRVSGPERRDVVRAGLARVNEVRLPPRELRPPKPFGEKITDKARKAPIPSWEMDEWQQADD